MCENLMSGLNVVWRLLNCIQWNTNHVRKISDNHYLAKSFGTKLENVNQIFCLETLLILGRYVDSCLQKEEKYHSLELPSIMFSAFQFTHRNCKIESDLERVVGFTKFLQKEIKWNQKKQIYEVFFFYPYFSTSTKMAKVEQSPVIWKKKIDLISSPFVL